MGKRIGIFGGSFNPIHVGHAIIASTIMQQHLVDSLWFMVTPENPFKQGNKMAPEVHRLRLTELVSRRIAGASTSAFEMQMPRPSYTIDTLNALQQKFPDDEFYLIIGADNWARWEQWKSADEIVNRFHVMVYPRLGFNVEIPSEISHRVKLIDAPVIEVSSTQIRNMIAHGITPAFYVTDDVCKYITQHNLYQ